MELTEQAKKKRNEYHKEWCRRNPDKVRATQKKYWEKKAAAADEKVQKNKTL